jgi:hypothetical protein
MNSKPICIDLYCGLGGWSEGFLSEGYECIGYDIEAHNYGSGGYPGTLILRDVRSIHGSECKDAACIVASPPCQEPSYRAMPWKRTKALSPEEVGISCPQWWDKPESKMSATELLMWRCWQREYPRPDPELFIELFNACFRIQREAIEAAGHYIPLVIENVRGAQRWVGRASANYGSYYLWGDVGMVGRRIVAGALRFGVSVAASRAQKFNPDGTNHLSGSWFAIADSKERGVKAGDRNVNGLWNHSFADSLKAPGKNWNEWKDWDGTEENKPKSVRPWGNGVKVAGMNWSDRNRPAQGFNVTAAQRYRDGVKQTGISGVRENGKGDKWFQDGAASHGSHSDSRKAASAMIAKIPFPLAQHIARAFKPIPVDSTSR